ncbi:MAG: hypothetical protein F6K04_06175 [Leptolyngbya sp. SIO4C5]|uniref:hypothetical protein n=1 Tax=Sphaerothrix gracilis TaxID=3151835 RepID=UPI0013C26179|nr:hypothetical protein [Leptolyngbya sp. SIO4C5]
MKDLIPHTETYHLPPNRDRKATATREPIRIIVIGSHIGINLIIGILHRLGFANATAWSKPQIDAKSGQPMRILTKWLNF